MLTQRTYLMGISPAIEHHSLHGPLWTAGDIAARLQVPRSTIYA